MNTIPQLRNVDNGQGAEIISATPITWGECSESIPCGNVKLPEILRTNGKIASHLIIDAYVVLGLRLAKVDRIWVVHLDKPRRTPSGGWLHIDDLLDNAELHLDSARDTWVVFPASKIEYPAPRKPCPKHRTTPAPRRVSRARKAVKRQRAALGGAR